MRHGNVGLITPILRDHFRFVGKPEVMTRSGLLESLPDGPSLGKNYQDSEMTITRATDNNDLRLFNARIAHRRDGVEGLSRD